MNITVEDIEKHVDEDGWDYFSDSALKLSKALDGVKVEDIEFGGGEGDGASMYRVIRVGDQFFKKLGRYNSWDASYWDGELYEVIPKVRPVTFYDRL